MNSDDRQRDLYDPAFEHDACGVGLVANLHNQPTREVVETGLGVLKRLMHRGATGNDPETGDGAGLLVQIPDGFFRKVVKGLPPAGGYAVAMVFGAEGEEAVFEEVLSALAMSAAVNPMAAMAIQTLSKLEGCQAHCTAILSKSDSDVFHDLGIDATCEPEFSSNNLYLS